MGIKAESALIYRFWSWIVGVLSIHLPIATTSKSAGLTPNPSDVQAVIMHGGLQEV